MQTILQLICREQISEPFHSTPEETRQHSHRRTALPQLPGRDLQQGDLPTVGVEQHQATPSHASQLLAQLHDQGDQQVRGQAEGAWKRLVFR